MEMFGILWESGASLKCTVAQVYTTIIITSDNIATYLHVKFDMIMIHPGGKESKGRIPLA